MKKCISAILSMLLCAGLLSGCGTAPLEGETYTVYVNQKGGVRSLDILEQEDNIDEEDVSAYVDEAVGEYAEEHGKGAVKVDSLTVDGNVATLEMSYKTAKDFSDFNGIELYTGKVLETLEAGYIYDGDFAKVEGGKVMGAATKQDIYKERDLKAVVIKANMDVRVDGEICYVSCENVKLTGADGVSIRDGYYLDNGSKTAASDEAVYGEIAAGTEAVGTEEMGQAQTAEAENAGTGQETVIDDGVFRTDVYTFIVYK